MHSECHAPINTTEFKGFAKTGFRSGRSAHLRAPWWQSRAAATRACRRPAAIPASAACMRRGSSPCRNLGSACHATAGDNTFRECREGLSEYPLLVKCVEGAKQAAPTMPSLAVSRVCACQQILCPRCM